jgi:hypothetical protein
VALAVVQLVLTAPLLVAVALALLVAPVAPAAGQDRPAPATGTEAAADADTVRRWSLALRGGFASPKGDLADLADDGQLLGLELGYRDRGLPRVRWLFEASLENMERGGGGQVLRAPLGPDIELWRLMGGGSVDLLEPGLSPWEISAQGLFGVTVVASSDFVARGSFVEPQPTVATGLTVGRRVGSRFTAFARADFYIWFDDTRPEDPNFLGKEVVLTHTFGLRWRF